MILKVIMAKLKTVLFSELARSLVSRFCSMQLWKTVRSSIVSRLQRLYNAASNRKMFLGVDWTSLQLWNCFSYYPAVTSWDILDGQAGKYIGKDKKMAPW